MTYIEAIVLGLVQGLGEFLPISSSGHLALIQQAFGISEDNVLLFAVLLHVGTLVSVFICYWSDIWELIVELGLTFKDIFTGKGLRIEERPVRKLGVMLRIAESLDRSMASSVHTINCDVLGDSVIMKTESDSDTTLEIKAALSAQQDFKRVFKKNLEIL